MPTFTRLGASSGTLVTRPALKSCKRPCNFEFGMQRSALCSWRWPGCSDFLLEISCLHASSAYFWHQMTGRAVHGGHARMLSQSANTTAQAWRLAAHPGAIPSQCVPWSCSHLWRVPPICTCRLHIQDV
eukprot:353426-Chlamydomonas_euryale.AAC.2